MISHPLYGLRARWPSCLAALLLAACSQSASQLPALDPGSAATCTLDGMQLQDFPGSKAQLRYDDGKTDYFCDVMELFAAVLAPEQVHPAGAMYVQDMGAAEWSHPQGHWIAATAAMYVVGSRAHGSMGATIVPFAEHAAAEAFAAREGGKVLHFKQVTAAMLLPAGGRH
jgi:copper chaperone NosL